jgi:protein gp37
MGQISNIEWTDATWNPVRGCSRVSPGCVHCYAETFAARFAAKPGSPFHLFAERTPSGPRWTGKVELMWDKLAEPHHWRQPKKIFVNSMSDLFHEALPETDIAQVFKTMFHENHHTYQVLTKRSARLKEIMPRLVATFGRMEHVWIGVSVEDRARKSRIDDLRQVDAAVRFLSIEPLLEDLGEIDLKGIHWVILGGESGPGARPCRMEWMLNVMGQCSDAGVPCFFKQAGGAPCVDYYTDDDLREWALSGKYTVFNHGSIWYDWHGQPTPGKSFIRVHLRDRKGGDLAELPEEFHIREFPIGVAGSSA